jgi:hypothetical protein
MPKISNLTSTTTSSANDLIVTVINTAGTAVTRQLTVNNFFANVAVANVANVSVGTMLVTNTSTPANDGPGFATGVPKGQIWSDGTYIYVATAANTVKRVAIAGW